MRQQLLLDALHLSTILSEAEREGLVDQPHSYSFGWSLGKEKFNGLPDVAKGSFYANPEYDLPYLDEKLIAAPPGSCRPNL